MKLDSYNLPILDRSGFGAISKKCLPNPSHKHFLLYFLLKEEWLSFPSFQDSCTQEAVTITALKSLSDDSNISAFLGLAFVDCLLPQESVTFSKYIKKF